MTRCLLFLLLCTTILPAGQPEAWKAPISIVHANHSPTTPEKKPPTHGANGLPRAPRWMPEAATFKDHRFTFGNIVLEGVSATFQVSTSRKGYDITLSDGSIAAMRTLPGQNATERPLVENMTFRGRFTWSEDFESLSLSDLRIQIPQRGAMVLSGEYQAEKGTARGRMECLQLDLGEVLSRVFALPPEFHLSLLLDAALEFQQTPNAPLRWNVKASSSGVEFHTEDFSVAGENIQADLEASGSLGAPGAQSSAALRLDLNRGECLFDKFYFDLAKTPLHISMDAAHERGSSSFLKVNRLDLTLESIIRLTLQGLLDLGGETPRGDLEVKGEMQPLEPLVNKFLKEPFADTLPDLEPVAFGGSWSGIVRIGGSLAKPNLAGRIELHGGSLANEQKGYDVQGISVILPFDFKPSQGGGSPLPVPGEKGHIQVARMHTPFLTLNEFRIPLQSFPNGYRLAESALIPADRGSVQILSLDLQDLDSAEPKGRMALRVSKLALDNFLRALFREELAASLDADNLEIQLRGDRVDSSGLVRLNTFAGEVFIDRIGMQQVFSTYRTFSLDAHWEDLDLEKLTLLTDFGRVTGHMEGHLKGLEIARGTPVAFDLHIQSTPRRRVSRKISVTAVENLTELSGGGSPFQGVGGIMASVFKTFRYREMGIACYLRNDFFTIRGTVLKDGTEYLVRRGGLGGINIINRNPDNRISWNDMLRRIQRIQRDSSPDT